MTNEQQQILSSLLKLYETYTSNACSHEKVWITTREVADINGMSIYKTRWLLLKLLEKGKVIIGERKIKRSSAWRPVIDTNSENTPPKVEASLGLKKIELIKGITEYQRSKNASTYQ